MRQRTLRSIALMLGCAAAATGALTAVAQQREPQQQQQQQQQPQSQPDARSGGGAGAAQPEQPQPPFGDRRGGDRIRGDGRFRPDLVAPPAPGSPGDPAMVPAPEERQITLDQTEEWRKAMDFMKEQSPKRWALTSELTEDRQQFMKEAFFSRYRQLERMKNMDRDMYELHLRQIGIEDELWTIRYSVRWRSQVLTPEEVSKVRERVTALLDSRFEERELRVQRLRDILKREEEILAAEKQRRETAIAEGTTQIERGERGGILSGTGGGGGGFGGGGFRGGPPPGPPAGGPPPGERRP